MVTKTNKIYIAGHKGMVGSAVWRALQSKSYTNLIGRTSKELDLRNQSAVNTFFENEKPEIVIDAAARVGGILANIYPSDGELQIQNNLLDAAFQNKFPFEQKALIKIDPRYFRPTEVELLIGDATKAKTKLGWEPKYDLKMLVKEMVMSDLIYYGNR
ncbi:MAG: NAD-dependent epimerase/dehydratase family protein [Bacteroidetes bacterium]|nr:NAD-dependent epimerase/dehydratase family protein [Bacteroidota bacterium]